MEENEVISMLGLTAKLDCVIHEHKLSAPLAQLGGPDLSLRA